MYRCQHNKAPWYLMDHCTSVSDVAYRQRLRSVSSHEVSVPRHRLSTYGRRAFAVAGSTVCNLCLRTCGIRRFLRTVTGSHWRRFCFRNTSVFSALEVIFHENALYKSTFQIDIDITSDVLVLVLIMTEIIMFKCCNKDETLLSKMANYT